MGNFGPHMMCGVTRGGRSLKFSVSVEGGFETFSS